LPTFHAQRSSEPGKSPTFAHVERDMSARPKIKQAGPKIKQAGPKIDVTSDVHGVAGRGHSGGRACPVEPMGVSDMSVMSGQARAFRQTDIWYTILPAHYRKYPARACAAPQARWRA